ncbi:MAG: hypothetical protein JWQ30_2276 [Sediminibacterium sp.]|nr:hypothetical protein [Sediminibacterium sp.]
MEPNDEILWAIAKKRAAFKKQLISYVIVNCFLWIVWFSSGSVWLAPGERLFRYEYFPWPIWVMLSWGIGLAFSFANAYLVNTKNAIEQEYQKLKNQQ